VIDWAPHGRCFIIKKPKVFAATIMPLHFKHTKITSFQRQLNLYGFKRITKGKDRGAYYHELFLRGRPKLSTKMRRQRIKGIGHKPLPDPENEPDFYAMEPLDTPSQLQLDDNISDAASLSQLSVSQLSGGLQSLVASVHSGDIQSLAASFPSVHSAENANLCVASANSLPQAALSSSGLSNASPVPFQAQMVGIVAQQQQQIGNPGTAVQGATQQSNELQLLSQLLDQQRQQIEQQQHQLQQRQQQLLQEELIMRQREVLLQQQQEQQKQKLMSLQGIPGPPVVPSLPLSQLQKQVAPTVRPTPANMSVSIPLGCDSTTADLSAARDACSTGICAPEAFAPSSCANFNSMNVGLERDESSKMPPPAARGLPLAPDTTQSSVPLILQDLTPKQASSSNEDPSDALSSFDSGSKPSSSRRGVSNASKSMDSLSKRLSVKSFGSMSSASKGSASKASRSSGRRKMPWSRRSQASASSNGSDGWLDEEQKAALEATIDFDSIFEGASAH